LVGVNVNERASYRFWVKLMTVTSNQVDLKSQQATVESANFEEVFVEQWPRVYGVLFRIVSDKAEAEDLALEAFWQLYKKPPAKADNLNGWLYRVAVNLGFNALRAKKRRAHYEERAGSLANEYNPSTAPEDELERAERRQNVQHVLAQMKPRSAQLLVLRHSGLSYAEIAAAMKVKPNSVGKLLSRAEDEFEKKYRQLLGE
jgi:RNA polymerase sigma-70 factor (ECF subfamily)